MKKKILILPILLIILSNSYSQITFEKGYFIDEAGQKFECLIKNIDWSKNPTGFQYKLTADGETKNATLETIKEFRVDGASKYIKAMVKIDQSPSDLSNLSIERNPIFIEKLLFLKVIIEGNATLYSYEEGTLTRFFYSTPGKEINQLVYKMYRNDGNVLNNYSYRQQLFQNLSCSGLDEADFNKLRYYYQDLKRIFIKYNKCDDPNYVHDPALKRKGAFNFSLRPGVSLVDLKMANPFSDYLYTEMDNKPSFRFGAEVEYILAFNKNKWAILIEPTYQYFSAEKLTDTMNPSYGVITTSVEYQSIEVPVGVRYSIFLNKDSKIFLNALGVFDFSFNSSVKFKRGNGSDLDSPLKIKAGVNPAVGLGYKIKNKYGIEIRYQINRNILYKYLLWEGKYNAAAIIAAYTF